MTKIEEKIVITTPKPTINPIVSAVSENLFSQILTLAENTLTSTNQVAPAQLPKCPGFCLLTLMTAFCERPSVLIASTSTCKKGSVCCDNTRYGSYWSQTIVVVLMIIKPLGALVQLDHHYAGHRNNLHQTINPHLLHQHHPPILEKSVQDLV